ncbi:hypothetical protein MTO96_044312, partial [Rhipicephalus appendiculatus]
HALTWSILREYEQPDQVQYQSRTTVRSGHHHPTPNDADSGVGVAKVQTRIDYGAGGRWCWTMWMPALYVAVVAVLRYVNSLDGDFVHDDMVAVVGNPGVTG